jgi:ribosomal protein S18 acetylase RimI-like enzyme
MPRNNYLTKLGQELVVREAEEKDFPKVWAIYQKVLNEGKFTSGFRRESYLGRHGCLSEDGVDTKKAFTLVAETGENLLGYVTIEESEWVLSRHVGELGIAVLPDYRGVGVGSALLKSALQLASEKRFSKISLSVFHTNSRAIDLYAKFGFTKVGRKKKQFKLNGKYVDEIIMERFVH